MCERRAWEVFRNMVYIDRDVTVEDIMVRGSAMVFVH